jgi:aminoglycoside phosphotransferase (APT) family kinase protein
MMISRDEIPAEIAQALPPIEALAEGESGCTSDVARLQVGGRQLILKRSRGEQFRGWLRREFEVLTALTATDLPVPRPHHFVADEAGDAAWLLMDFRPGRPLAAVMAEADEQGREQLLELMGQTLRLLHQSPIPPHMADQSAAVWLDHKLAEAEFNLNRYGTDGDAALLARLQRYRPGFSESRLIHGDYNCDNILLAEDGTVSIIDWSGGAVGDPRSDIALALNDADDANLAEAGRLAFYRGYGSDPLPAAALQYFVNLYEFF